MKREQNRQQHHAKGFHPWHDQHVSPWASLASALGLGMNYGTQQTCDSRIYAKYLSFDMLSYDTYPCPFVINLHRASNMYRRSPT
jgi:hypothetical protein